MAGLLPGKHRLIASRGRREEPQIASASVEVIDRDIQGLTLALGSGAAITGRIVSESQESVLDWRRVEVVTPAGCRRSQGDDVWWGRSPG